jgi:hypothetical protein
MKELIAPDKMGKPFKALIQGKALPENLALRGLTFKAFAKDALGENQ